MITFASITVSSTATRGTTVLHNALIVRMKVTTIRTRRAETAIATHHSRPLWQTRLRTIPFHQRRAIRNQLEHLNLIHLFRRSRNRFRLTRTLSRHPYHRGLPPSWSRCLFQHWLRYRELMDTSNRKSGLDCECHRHRLQVAPQQRQRTQHRSADRLVEGLGKRELIRPSFLAVPV